MALSRSHRRDEVNFWPGFVDALSTMLIGIVFLLSVFVLGQFFLSQELTGKDTALDRLNRQISELTDLLALERASNRQAQENLTLLQSSLTREQAERGRIQDMLAAQPGNQAAQLGEAQKALEAEKQLSARAQATVDMVNQQILAMRRQLAALEEALGASEAKDREAQARISELGSRLNVALAQRVQELARYRSDFFGRLRQVLGTRPDIRVVGDRFVFQSEVFFDAGQAVLKPEGRGELDKLGAIIADLGREMPPDLPWILRVDGHTDNRPIRSPQFPSNWHLSAARAIAVVEYLVTKGISADRIAATGFGEFQPLDVANTDDAWRRNRRIEFKITER
ncbi:MAG: peptidoglycan -binding protein [Bosea sp. (in: a-proteobacteria)]|uniref:peptidoglycan -binding protein n=1 Tax=Bosea sp. (in: a-proteobacteria) TaxID=1871050 RepID=UPI002735EDC6|nr:peptidoglycan -binding protein [Bosea sp. (in: a-proteobacteria)]MDP3257285.1 peptidoglycan -binding protein [Bosea sp. (in: a-proteobacteria)]MDP3319930.1 peptidoglycan -binding protein [Bosea sp. (in: a-proteobacteria)]